MGIPNFIVAGTQKAATTWLYECLREHPDIFVPNVKEIHFFCRPPCRSSKFHLGFDWYKSQFPKSGRYKAVGEISIDYMYYEYVAREIYSFNSNLKILFILRNPVDRAYSAYWMNRRHKPEMPPFADFIKADNHFINRGFYYRQLMKYYECFDKRNLFILIYDDLLMKPDVFVKNVYSFIEVDSDFTPDTLNQKVAATRNITPLAGFFLYKHFAPILKKSPLFSSLWRFIKHKTPLSKYYKDKQSSYPPLSDEDRHRLKELYREENKKLFELIGREIPQWRS